MRVDRTGAVTSAPAPPPDPDRSGGRGALRREPARTGGRRDPGAVLARLGTLPAVLVTGWLVASYPFVLAGADRPVPVLLLAVPVVALLVGATRGLPPIPRTPWWAVVSTMAVAVGFAALAAARHAEPLVLRRDPGVYALAAHWLAGHGGLTVPAGLAAAGGPDASFTAASPGFYLRGDSILPQFMSGNAIALAPGDWMAGWVGVFTLPAIYAGLALLAVAGLAARLVGPRWAPLAALTLGLCQPQLLTARTTLSEPLAQLLLFGALCLLLDAAAAADGRAGRWSGVPFGLAGLVFGIGTLIRIEALREVLLVILVVGWLAAHRRPQWKWLAAGTVAGTGFGVVDALGPSRAYVSDAFYLIRPALLLGAVLAVGTTVAVLLVRRYGLPERGRQWLAAAGAVGAVAVSGYLFVRPWLQTAHQRMDETVRIIAGLQRDQQLPVDGTRTYAEQSLRWLSWHVGWLAVAIAAAAGAVLVWAALRGFAERWALVLPVLLASTTLVLYRPGITPDHPWADRRLVPVVLPTVALLGVAAVATAVRHLASRFPAPDAGRASARVLALGVVAAAGAGLLAVPAVVGSAPLFTARTEVGELAAVEEACAAFGPGDVALAIDARSRQELVPVLRQVCEVPTFAVPAEPGDESATREQVATVARRVRAAGGRPVLVAQSAEPLPRLTGVPQRQIVDLVSTEYERALARRATRLVPLRVELWVAAAD